MRRSRSSRRANEQQPPTCEANRKLIYRHTVQTLRASSFHTTSHSYNCAAFLCVRLCLVARVRDAQSLHNSLWPWCYCCTLQLLTLFTDKSTARLSTSSFKIFTSAFTKWTLRMRGPLEPRVPEPRGPPDPTGSPQGGSELSPCDSTFRSPRLNLRWR